jgi:tetratricopeptide (TPR) repeat protein
LLILDYWPLQRVQRGNSVARLVIEKIPLFLLSVCSSAATILAQKSYLVSTRQLPVWWRLGNALVSYVVYLRQTIWPVRLAVFYPIVEDQLQLWPVLAAFAVLASITGAAILLRRSRPYIFTGWFWYLGILVPVIGVVQVGVQAHADRYMYLPQIGLSIIVGWGLVDLARRLQFQSRVGIAAVVALALLAIGAWRQTGFWRNGETLWTRALAVTDRNEVAHYGLGDILVRNDQPEKAIDQFRATLNIRPHWPYAEDYLGLVLLHAGHIDEALEHFATVLRLMPQHPTIHFDLGNALFQKGDLDGAVEQYREALKKQSSGVVPGFVQPDYAAAHYDLGNCYIQRGDPRQAITEYQEAVRLFPESARVHNNLAFALSQTGQTRQAIDEWQAALRLDPKNIEVLGNLAWILATTSDGSIRDGARAVDLAQQALQVSRDNAKVLRVLAAAQAATGNFEQAVQTAQQALALADRQGDRDSIDNLQSDLLLYGSKQPLRN